MPASAVRKGAATADAEVLHRSLPGHALPPPSRASVRPGFGVGWPDAAGALSLLVLAFVAQSVLWETNPDTSWLITIIDRLHAGDRLFVDVIELNPPSSVWIYFIPVHLSYLSGIPAEAIVRAWTLMLLAAGTITTGWIIRVADLMPASAVRPMLALLFLVSAVLVGNCFSERDHIGAVLLTPLIAMAAWRIGDAPAAPRPQHWLAAGLAGAVIALVKPYYAIVVLAVAALVVARRRDLRLFLLPEFLVAGAATTAYMAGFYYAYPSYFRELLPLLRETYMAFSWPLSSLLLLAAPWLAVVAVQSVLAKRGGRSLLADVFLVAAVAAWVPFFVQGKGWAYHAYPAIYLGSAALLVGACRLLFGREAAGEGRAGAAEIIGLVVIAVVVVHLRFLENTAPSRSFAAAIRARLPAPTVGLLGGDIAAGHPLARMIGGRWVEPYCSDWIPTFALRLAGRMQVEGDVGRAAYFEQMANEYLAAKRERLLRSPPDALIVDEDDLLVDLMIRDSGFAGVLARYVRIGADRNLAVYRRIAAPAGAIGS
jgi:hypothetical protein